MSRIKEIFHEVLKPWHLEIPREHYLLKRQGMLESDMGCTPEVHYLFGRDEKGEYLDYCLWHRFGDQHGRIYENGETMLLEMPCGLLPCHDAPMEQDRLRDEHYKENRRISDLLKAKGFL